LHFLIKNSFKQFKPVFWFNGCSWILRGRFLTGLLPALFCLKSSLKRLADFFVHAQQAQQTTGMHR
jgi:hypothetical protein